MRRAVHGHAVLGGEHLRHIDQIHHLLAQTGGRHLLQFQRVAQRRHVGDQLACLLDVELLLGGARAGAAAQPCQLLARQVAAAGLAHVGLPVTLHTLQHVRAVTALERVDRAVVHLPHRLAHLIQEPAVVRHQQQRALPLAPAGFQVFGQPVDRDHVQMVGRLVQRQDVPVLEQQAGQIGAAALATGQRADARIQTDAAEQRLHDLARARLRRPLVVLASLQCGLAHGGVVVERIALVEHAEAQPPTLGHTTRIGFLRAVEQVQQRGFAIAVAADDADAVALEHTLRHVGEDRLGRERKRHLFQPNIVNRHNPLIYHPPRHARMDPGREKDPGWEGTVSSGSWRRCCTGRRSWRTPARPAAGSAHRPARTPPAAWTSNRRRP